MTLWTVACQASLFMEFSREKYWSGLPFPSPADLLTQGLNPRLLDCKQILYHLSHQRSPQISQSITKMLFDFPVHVCKARFSLYTSTKSNIFQQSDGRGRFKNPVAFMKPITKEAGKRETMPLFSLNVVVFFLNHSNLHLSKSHVFDPLGCL